MWVFALMKMVCHLLCPCDGSKNAGIELKDGVEEADDHPDSERHDGTPHLHHEVHHPLVLELLNLVGVHDALVAEGTSLGGIVSS